MGINNNAYGNICYGGNCNYKMEKVMNSDGATEWKGFLDVRKSFVPLVSRRFPRNHKETELESLKK